MSIWVINDNFHECDEKIYDSFCTKYYNIFISLSTFKRGKNSKNWAKNMATFKMLFLTPSSIKHASIEMNLKYEYIQLTFSY